MTLNVGIVGTGIFATDVHLPTIKKLDNLNLVACYNRSKDKAEKFAEKAGIASDKIYESLEQVFEDKSLDFVDVLLPAQYNLDAVKLAAKNKKPIVFEKPIAANLEQAEEIVKISRETDIPIGVLENWSFRKSVNTLKEKYLPKVGQVVSFTYRYTGPWKEQNKYLATSWRQNPQHIGGFLSDGGVHQLAFLTGILGDVESISALTKQVRKESGDDDVIFSTMKLVDGTIGTFTYGSAFGATDQHCSLVVYGTNGSFTYNFAKDLKIPTVTYQTGPSLEQASEVVTEELPEEDTFVDEFSNFAEAVVSKKKDHVLVPPEVAYHHLAIVAAALESTAHDGSSVKVKTI